MEQGPADHERDFNVKVYASRRVTADSETLRALGDCSEPEIHEGTGLSRRIIRRIRHDGQVKPRTMQRITDFLTRKSKATVVERTALRAYYYIEENAEVGWIMRSLTPIDGGRCLQTNP
jgi:hypothetical protein